VKDKHVSDALQAIEKEVADNLTEGGFPGIIWDTNESGQARETDDDPTLNVGYRPINMFVETFENKHSILKCFPTGELSPQPFVEGSFLKFQKVVAAVKTKFGLEFPGIVMQWNDFLLTAPKSDDASEYEKEHPLYIPFREVLFGIRQSDGRYASTRDECAASECAAMKTQSDKDAESASKIGRFEAETWRTLPCMNKGAAAAFERVKTVTKDGGAVTTQEPFYESSEEDMSDQSSEDDNSVSPRWCTVRHQTHVPKFGDALAYVGLNYSRRLKNSSSHDLFSSGTIDKIVRKSDVANGELHFKLLNAADGATHELCKAVMSTNKRGVYKVSST